MEYDLSQTEREQLSKLLLENPTVMPVIQALIDAGGLPLLVGGAVRNIILNLPVSDIDIEVHHLSLEKVERVLQHFGHVDCVGKSFGVLRVYGVPVEWALPRRDQGGRKPHVVVDEQLPIEIALRRRDLTMNAMAINIRQNILIDPFGGRRDIDQKVLRTPDPHFFVQDPLRFFRLMQFIARFHMQPDAILNNICITLDIGGISRERIDAEFRKLLLTAATPSWGLRWLDEIGRLAEILPELAATQGVMQDMQWHPEGDVFEHTLQVVDAAARQIYADDDERTVVMYAALCHDLGKTVTTVIHEGRIRSIGHEQAGVPLAHALLRRITTNKRLSQIVEILVRHHMAPGNFIAQNASAGAYKRLAYSVAPLVNLRMLGLLATADKQGRNPQRGTPLSGAIGVATEFMRRAAEYGVLYEPEPPILRGEDVMDIVAPGKAMGDLLQRAYEIQINKGVVDKGELLKRLKYN